jgi:hypothetical protein
MAKVADAMTFTRFNGDGFCIDANNKLYDYFTLQNQLGDYNAAHAWCQTAAAFTARFVGLSIFQTNWYCMYDDSTGMSRSDFTPNADYDVSTNSGTGPVVNVNGATSVDCCRYDVSMSYHFQLQLHFLSFTGSPILFLNKYLVDLGVFSTTQQLAFRKCTCHLRTSTHLCHAFELTADLVSIMSSPNLQPSSRHSESPSESPSESLQVILLLVTFTHIPLEADPIFVM